MNNVLYRYHNNQDVVLLETLPIIKKTPCGAWISVGSYPPKKRFVLDGTKKRYAYPTTEEAKTSFLARKRREMAILRHRRMAVARSVVAMKAGRIADYASSVYFEL